MEVWPALLPDHSYDYFVCVHRTLLTIVGVALLFRLTSAQVAPLPVGTILPSVVCNADSKQSYALYLPSNFSSARPWPIIYVFDPAARGQVAVETMKPAAEQFGYIVVASNNSRNGRMGDSGHAMTAMWRDTQ